MRNDNKLQGKTILWNGDSLCYGTRVWGNWATRIAEWNGAWCVNYAVGGGTVTENVPFSDEDPRMRHSVCATLEKMHKEHPSADYVVFDGGGNDSCLLGGLLEGERPARIGEIKMNDYGGEYDANTYCGALDTLFYKATRYWTGAKIAYIVPPRMAYHIDGKNARAYYDLALMACRKWGIPYLDLSKRSYLNSVFSWQYDPALDVQGNIDAGNFYIDGQHLSEAGYDVTADIIDSFLKTL